MCGAEDGVNEEVEEDGRHGMSFVESSDGHGSIYGEIVYSQVVGWPAIEALDEIN